MDKVDQLLKALDALKDWSNYLLVTTVAALGWASTQVTFTSPTTHAAVVGSLASSVVLGIVTLALIPLVAENLEPNSGSIYNVSVDFNLLWMWPPLWRLRLKWACWPQHVLFGVGIVIYACAAMSGGIGPSNPPLQPTSGTEATG